MKLIPIGVILTLTFTSPIWPELLFSNLTLPNLTAPNFLTPNLATEAAWAQARPKNRRPAGRKGVCPTAQSLAALTAVVPAMGDDLSLSPTPTFLFLIPDAPQPNLKATFRLQADRRNVMPPFAVPIAHTPGIIKVQLPQPVESEKQFQWSLQVTCGAEKSFELTGTLKVKAADPELMQQLGKASTERERAALYQKAGFWLDAVAALAVAPGQDPQAQADWQKLLQTLDLPELQQQPVVACCTTP
jgi:hypothetical protein